MTNELEDMERRLRAKWAGDKPRQRLDEQEAAIACRFFGRDNAERLQKVKEGSRFRPAPVRTHYEYWWVDGSIYSMGGWQMVRIENGRQEPHTWDQRSGEIQKEVSRLRKLGFTVREIRLGDFERSRKQESGSERKRVLDSLANFKMGRR